MNQARVILFAGGGTGGHIFPNVAIAQRLRELDDTLKPRFVVSNRPLDQAILDKASLSSVALDARAFSIKPAGLAKFATGWRRSMRRMGQLLNEAPVRALVATGGFVSAPAVAAARRAGVPVALVNLDAAPGKANRLMARRATALFSAYPVARWQRAQTIGMPLRHEALCELTPQAARSALGMSPDRPMLLVTGGSQGATSINQLMATLAQRGTISKKWQVFHLAGSGDTTYLSDAYQAADISARVVAFWDDMGLAWRAAELAIARCGASTCAEAWANACPALFLPYPYHRDEHQRLNAQPLADAGGAIIYRDQIDADKNAAQLAPPLETILIDTQRRQSMAEALRESAPIDGAAAVARWLANLT